MLTVKEYTINPRRAWVGIGIHDGWKPLQVFERKGEIVLSVLVNTEAVEEREIVRLVRPGEDVEEASEGLDSTFLGQCMGKYLFLDLPEEKSLPPIRRVSHPRLLTDD